MLSAPFLATTYAISETKFLPLFFRIPWKSRAGSPTKASASGRAWRSDRSVSGSRSGETIQFYVEGGDRWSLVFANDNTLVGTAVKPDGNTYALSFTR